MHYLLVVELLRRTRKQTEFWDPVCFRNMYVSPLFLFSSNHLILIYIFFSYGSRRGKKLAFVDTGLKYNIAMMIASNKLPLNIYPLQQTTKMLSAFILITVT